LVFIPIFFTILVMIIFNNRSSSNFTPLFFLIGCYSSVDEIVPTGKVRFLFRTFYNLSACIVLAILVLLSLQFDKKISLEWSTYFIFSGFLIALSFILLSVFFIGTSLEIHVTKRFFLLYVLASIVTLCLLVGYWRNLYSLIIVFIPLFLLQLFNLCQAVQWNAPTVPDPPPPPQILNFMNDTLTLYIVPPNANRATIREYVVEMVTIPEENYLEPFSTEDKGNTQKVVYCGPNSLVNLHDTVLPGIRYYFMAKARNIVGESNRSEPSEPFIFQPKCPNQPAPPQISLSERGAMIRWLMPNDNSSEITHYKIRVEELSTGKERLETVNGDRLFTEVKSLTPTFLYAFSIQAINEAGASPWSFPVQLVFKLD